ncbi:thiamine-phosphate kinase [Legionella londiniensis]|uniref:Thiamine-monophosphate kinase n=1 Tax=Legionella londiniensis TaxID=45068 RepID=A0A0W0VPM0_9GAMM|nr:thiamine-phosphate kinase [Legionella londiniensis]KTD21869.1 thiamine monophosphate kinase (AIR synthase) [Legionella londiniensis]STX92648.1 thiamine monophosphate kinase (AIR synthase) [Legionella londiniensis]
MNEFELINTFFKSLSAKRPDVVLGIGDDAACLCVPIGHDLVVSSDTLVANIHFLSDWDAYDIAYKAVMVNVSDIAAMGGDPNWMMLALTLPESDASWLKRYAEGLYDAMREFNLALVGGDTTRGPLAMTICIHGLVPSGKAVTRSGASPGDIVYVSGPIGAAAQAVAFLDNKSLDANDRTVLMNALMHPKPRVDLNQILLRYATSAIDISDGLAADLNHICEESDVGAILNLEAIPVHPLVKRYQGDKAIDFALHGGDDYELCFTVSEKQNQAFLCTMAELGLHCFPVGCIAEEKGMRGKEKDGTTKTIQTSGYSHF